VKNSSFLQPVFIAVIEDDAFGISLFFGVRDN